MLSSNTPSESSTPSAKKWGLVLSCMLSEQKFWAFILKVPGGPQVTKGIGMKQPIAKAKLPNNIVHCFITIVRMKQTKQG